MTLLVTGGAGFIGSHFIERMLRGGEPHIVCVDNFNDYYDPAVKRANVRTFAADPRVTMVEESFGNADVMRAIFERHAVGLVVHLGAYAGVRPSIERPLVYEEANVRGTLVLLEAARSFPIERFVFASSSTVYGRGAQAPFQEDQPLGVPLSPYGASKRAAELLCLTYHDLHELPIVIVRPFSVYGPRLRPDLAMSIFSHAILADSPLTLLGDGTIRRDFTHVSDICDGLAAALAAPAAVGHAINLGHDAPVEIRELIELLERALGRRARVEVRPQAAGDMPLTHADLSKARRLLNYRPRVQLPDGIAEFAAWTRERMKAEG
jgi:UDP-glucuronate 4-epimerase